MRISRYIIFTLLLTFGCPNFTSAQFSVYHELGGLIGPVFFKSDYGQRNDFQTNIENSGLGVGVVHYMNFAYSRFHNNDFKSYLREHVKLRSEFSYNYTTFQHYGKWAEKNSVGGNQLREMRGATRVFNLGIGGELSLFKDIHEFEMTDGSFSPFVGLGAQFSYYDPKVYSNLGDITAPGVLFPKFSGGVTNQSGYVWSVVVNAGTRYKLNPMSDLIFDLRGQYYFSDWVDGLNPDPARNPSNKYNDWNIWFAIGYIHYLGSNL